MPDTLKRTEAGSAAKRMFDLAVSIPLLVLVSPILLFLSVSVRLLLGRPVFFRQVRPGRNGIPFTILKFRTMTDARDSVGVPLSDAARLTRFGRFLRRSSLDELPELLNVIAGDMSLVGPRPLLMEYLDRYTQEQARRHEVLPGITGLAQVSGRNAISWEQKFELDVWYVDHRSMALDLLILLKTFGKIIASEGITQAGEATAAEFLGSDRARKFESYKFIDRNEAIR